MPRVIELVGCAVLVIEGEVQETDPGDGQPLFSGGAGGPKLETRRGLIFLDPITGDQTRVVLSEQERAEVVRGLTGGIEIPKVALPA